VMASSSAIRTLGIGELLGYKLGFAGKHRGLLRFVGVNRNLRSEPAALRDSIAYSGRSENQPEIIKQ
ncbi:MAG: hypothetical protein LC731_08425, partial [Acidobacteria bacterium]|nr:hypothetical protein [Acidobacteriota bacterium]